MTAVIALYGREWRGTLLSPFSRPSPRSVNSKIINFWIFLFSGIHGNQIGHPPTLCGGLAVGATVRPAPVGHDIAAQVVVDELLDQGRAVHARHRGVDGEALGRLDAPMDGRLALYRRRPRGSSGGLAFPCLTG